jgi:MerR family transcriptional regulator, copper efflux regulator
MQTATAVDALTINEAAETTGWSARMLRYIESIGLVEPARSDSGYRLYGPAELQRLSTLRELLDERELDLGEVGFALKLQREPALREAIELWLAAEPARPEHVNADEWLRFEQEKHQRLLADAKPSLTPAVQASMTTRGPSVTTPGPSTTTAKPHTTMEIA